MTSKWDVVRALKTSSLPPPSRLLMMMLIDAADADTAEIPAAHTPSLSDLEAWTGLGRSTITRRLNDLETDGWVVRERPSVADARSKGAKTQYRLAIGKDDAPAEEPSEAVSEEPESVPEPRPTAGLGPERAYPSSPRAGLASPTAGPVVVPERASFLIAPHTPLPPTGGDADAPQQPALIEDESTKPPPKPETVNQRANRLTKVYYELVPMCTFMAVSKIVAKAIGSGYDDDQIAAGLKDLGSKPHLAVSLNSLRIAIEGQRARSPDQRDVSTPEAIEQGWNRKGRKQ